MNLYTIGFTQKTAERFFTLLRDAGVRRLVDTRLNNRSQLAGFSKYEDLRYFLRVIGGIEYVHRLDMAPTQELLDGYKKGKGAWELYETAFRALLDQRRLIEAIDPSELANSCLLCSEHLAAHCHRRIVAEYIQRHVSNVTVTHLK
ncbi:MAG: DUF488 domain-containing protein [Gemmatimonadaceae bacterium]|nr:DUF488 domain-containing protein [Gemmatimonadaceae bacterium]